MKSRYSKKEDRLRDEQIMKALEEVAERLSVQVHYEEMKAFEFRVQDGSCRVKGEPSIFIDRKRPLKEKISILAKELKKFESREYKLYKEEEKLSSLPRTLYEKACRATNRIIDIQPDKRTRKMLQEAIDFAHLKITPNQIASLTILFAFFICFPTLFLTLTRLLFPFINLSAIFSLFTMIKIQKTI